MRAGATTKFDVRPATDHPITGRWQSIGVDQLPLVDQCQGSEGRL